MTLRNNTTNWTSTACTQNECGHRFLYDCLTRKTVKNVRDSSYICRNFRWVGRNVHLVHSTWMSQPRSCRSSRFTMHNSNCRFGFAIQKVVHRDRTCFQIVVVKNGKVAFWAEGERCISQYFHSSKQQFETSTVIYVFPFFSVNFKMNQMNTLFVLFHFFFS